MGTKRQGREERKQERRGEKEKRARSEFGGNEQQPEAEVGNEGSERKKRKKDGESLDKGSVSIEGTMRNAASDALLLPQQTKRAIHDTGCTRRTEIQIRLIPQFLRLGRDVFGAAWTDSGKAVSYLKRAVELLDRGSLKRRVGTGVIVICPTLELAEQIYGGATYLLKHRSHTHGMMGGSNREREAEKLREGVNLLVATPGRLLDHIRNTEGFLYENLKYLVIDEADRILETGSEDMKEIIEILPRDRQTALFSATLTHGVEDLARVSLNNPIYVGVEEGLKHGYCVVSSSTRFHSLLTFLEESLNKKVMVFCSSCDAVKYHSTILSYMNIPCLDIHHKQKQEKLTTTYFEFCNADEGILLCTDVAVRGLDIPAVDWIIQYDPPNDPEDYLLRVGRTPSREGARGTAMLFLRPEELKFLEYFKGKVPLDEYCLKPDDTLSELQTELGKLVEKHNELHRLAQYAYRSHLLAYNSHAMKDIFNFRDLNLAEVGFSFCLISPPKFNRNG